MLPKLVSSIRYQVSGIEHELRRRGGFTLVELLVVISVIGVLSTVGLVVYSGTQRNARDSRRIADLKQIQSAFEQYYTSHRYYPPNAGEINGFFEQGSVPVDPLSTARDYTIRYPGGTCAEQTYIVCAELENCQGKCNRDSVPGDACDNAVVPPGTGTQFYCVTALSN